MIKWGMEVAIPPQSYRHDSNWLVGKNKITSKWSQEENKLFEDALAIYDIETPNGWQKIAAMIPGKSVVHVMNQYRELVNDVTDIEAGLIPIPGYTTSLPLNLENNGRFAQSYDLCAKRGSSAYARAPSDYERKKGVPWTEEEHKLFLLGLKKYGKGDWRNISRNFVITRTPTQVASHAQKYFIRQLSGGKDKRRSSIHDITIMNLSGTGPISPDKDANSMLQQPSDLSGTTKALFDWNYPHPHGGESVVFNSASSYETTEEGQDMHKGSIHESHLGPLGVFFQMQTSQCPPQG